MFEPLVMATKNDNSRQPVNSEPSISPSETQTDGFGLVRGARLLEIVFPEKESRPSLRSLQRYVRRRIIPSVKLGHQRFYSPEQVHEALLGHKIIRGGNCHGIPTLIRDAGNIA